MSTPRSIRRALRRFQRAARARAPWLLLVVPLFLMQPGRVAAQTTQEAQQIAQYKALYLGNLIIYDQVITAQEQRAILAQLTPLQQSILMQDLVVLDYILALSQFSAADREFFLELLPSEIHWGIVLHLQVLPLAQANVQRERQRRQTATTRTTTTTGTN